MKLAKPLEFSDSIKAIKIARKELPKNANVIIAGWGKTSESGSISEDLKYNTLYADGQKECALTAQKNFDGLLCLEHSQDNGACYVSFQTFLSSNLN